MAQVASSQSAFVPPARGRFLWSNTILMAVAHALGLFGLVYICFVDPSAWTLALTATWWLLCSLSITAGYHRLWAHHAYAARWPLRLLFLLFGAASAQNSALRWVADHRRHHTHTDSDEDPYDARRGFWWTHIGWIFFEGTPSGQPRSNPRDLEADPLVRWQHAAYLPLTILMGGLVPMAIGLAWGDPWGALLGAGFARLVLQWHMTFFINSLAHCVGRQPYSRANSARDSWISGALTLGEGYHNYHHRFPSDYRNGHRWFHLDATKWFLWSMSRFGLAGDLRRTRPETISKAVDETRAADLQAV